MVGQTKVPLNATRGPPTILKGKDDVAYGDWVSGHKGMFGASG